MKSSLTLPLLAAAVSSPFVFQEEVKNLEACPCVSNYVAAHKRAAFTEGQRLYLVDQRLTAKSGLHHQESNLQFLLVEAFALGRAAVAERRPAQFREGLPIQPITDGRLGSASKHRRSNSVRERKRSARPRSQRA